MYITSKLAVPDTVRSPEIYQRMVKKGTTVSNQYKEDIFVTVVADRKHLDEIEANIGIKDVAAGARVKVANELVEKSGFTRIGPNMAMKFYLDKRKVYISAVAESGRKICESHPYKGNTPVSVNDKGYLVMPNVGKVDDNTFVSGYGAKRDGDHDSEIKVETSQPQNIADWVVGDVNEFIQYCNGLEEASPYEDDR